MSKPEPVAIPARVPVREFGEAIDRDLEEVQAALSSRGEPYAPEDLVEFELVFQLSRAFGADVVVEARDLALEYLYENETKGEISSSFEGRAGRLAGGVTSDVEDLDARIEAASEHWSVARMPVVDRNILRLAVFELLNEPGVSTAIIISEAVRLAQIYSTERSGSFVNGVLATLAREIREG
jgi:transcription antitermination factor NusB